MIPLEVLYYDQKKLPKPPSFQCDTWDKVHKIIGIEKIFEMHECMGMKRFTCNTLFQYSLKMLAFKCFYEGCNDKAVSHYFDIPPSTAHDYYLEYLEYFKAL